MAAIVLLDIGADKFVDHTAIVARRLGVSETLIALLTAGAEWEEVRSKVPLVVDIMTSSNLEISSLLSS